MILQFPYEQTAQPPLTALSFNALTRCAISLLTHTAQLRPALDFAVSKGFTAISEALPDRFLPLSWRDAQALLQAHEALRRTLQQLQPVLCPHLMGTLKKDMTETGLLLAPLTVWMAEMRELHHDYFRQGCPGVDILWLATLAGSPAHFTQRSFDWAPLKRVVFKRGKTVFFEHDLHRAGQAYSIKELLDEISSLPLEVCTQISRCKVSEKEPGTVFMYV